MVWKSHKKESFNFVGSCLPTQKCWRYEPHLWNKSTLIKMLWNLHMKSDKLWIRWVNAYYLKGDTILHWHVKDTHSWMIKSIIKVREIVLNNAYWEKVFRCRKLKLARCIRKSGAVIPLRTGERLFSITMSGHELASLCGLLFGGASLPRAAWKRFTFPLMVCVCSVGNKII